MAVWTLEFDRYWGVVRPVRDGEPIYGTDTYTKSAMREWLGALAGLTPEKIEELINAMPVEAWWRE